MRMMTVVHQSVSIIYSDDEASEIQSDIEDFERKELEHNIVFSSSLQRVSCFSHTLQLVVCKI